MSESQEQRMERLTELARQAWPEFVQCRVGHLPDSELWQLQVETRDFHSTVIRLNHVSESRALDALEAALRVLAGEEGGDYLIGVADFQHSRAESAERDLGAAISEWEHWRARAMSAERALAELRARLEALAAEWRGRVPVNLCEANEYGAGRAQVHEACADELSAALKGTT